MKTPINNENDLNGNQDNQRQHSVTQSDVLQAQARAARAQEEAIILREKLESMECLLSVTKTKLAEKTLEIEEKDERLKQVNEQSKNLAASVTGLETRFQSLKLLQGQLAEKRETLITSLESSAAESRARIEQLNCSSSGTSIQEQPSTSEPSSEVETMSNATVDTKKKEPELMVREIDETIESEDGLKTKIKGKEVIAKDEQSDGQSASRSVAAQSKVKEVTTDEAGNVVGVKKGVGQSVATELVAKSVEVAPDGAIKKSQSAVSESVSKSVTESKSAAAAAADDFASMSSSSSKSSSSSSSMSSSSRTIKSSTFSSSSSFESISNQISSIETVSEELGKILGTGLTVTDMVTKD